MSMRQSPHLLAYYLSLTFLFGGILLVFSSYMGMNLDVWITSGWGFYFMANFVLSMGCTVVVLFGLKGDRLGFSVLFGLMLAQFLLGTYRVFLDITSSSSQFTLAIPVLLAHTYLIFLLAKTNKDQQR